MPEKKSRLAVGNRTKVGSKREMRKVILTGLYHVSKRKSNWIGHILCRKCLLKGVIEGKIKGGIEETGRRGRRRR